MKCKCVLCTMFLFIMVWCLMPLAAFAAEQIVEADGYYTVGDGLEENHSTAKLRAKEAAKGRAAEQAAVLVEKSVSVKNHQLTASEIRTLAAKVMKIKEEAITPEVDGNTIRYHCHIVAVVDDGNVMNDILADKQKLAEAVLETEELRARNEALAREMEELKQKMKSANDAEQRSLLDQSKTNDIKFQATQWYEMGNQMRDDKDYDGAVASFRKAISLDPGFAEAYNNLGNTYLFMEDYAKAIENAKQAIALNPKLAHPYGVLGGGYYMLGDYTKSIENLNKAIELGLRHPRMYAMLGAAYVTAADYTNAFPILKQAIALDTDGTEETTVDSYYLLGVSYCAKREFTEAMEVFKESIARYPKDPRAVCALGSIYQDRGEHGEAIECYNKAIALAPDSVHNAPTYCNLGKIYGARGEYQKSIEYFDKAIELEPKYPSAYCNRGVSNYNLGRLKEAKRDFAKAYELDPNDEEYREKKRMSENW